MSSCEQIRPRSLCFEGIWRTHSGDLFENVVPPNNAWTLSKQPMSNDQRSTSPKERRISHIESKAVINTTLLEKNNKNKGKKSRWKSKETNTNRILQWWKKGEKQVSTIQKELQNNMKNKVIWNLKKRIKETHISQFTIWKAQTRKQLKDKCKLENKSKFKTLQSRGKKK